MPQAVAVLGIEQLQGGVGVGVMIGEAAIGPLPIGSLPNIISYLVLLTYICQWQNRFYLIEFGRPAPLQGLAFLL